MVKSYAAVGLKKAKSWLKGRAGEKSTYVGITSILAGFGVINDPEAIVEVIAAAGVIIGFIFSMSKEKPDPEDEQNAEKTV